MQQQPPLVSIVMPVYNGAVLLGPTLQALTQQTICPEDVELIVVDDGSSDNPAEIVASVSFPFPCRLIQQPNLGLSVARNRGVMETAGTIILFLDQDMIADPELVAAHVDCHRQHSSALVAGRRVAWSKARTSLVTQILDLESTDVIPDEVFGGHPYQFVIGANFSIPRADILAIGGFDEDFPPGGGFEDVDLAYRAHSSGLTVIRCPRAVGSHNHPKTLKAVCSSAERYNRSAPLFFSKHPELRGAFPYLMDKWPIIWKNDPPWLILRKAVRRILALPAVLWTTVWLTLMLEQFWPSSGLLGKLYRAIIGSYQLRGLRWARLVRPDGNSTRLDCQLSSLSKNSRQVQ